MLNKNVSEESEHDSSTPVLKHKRVMEDLGFAVLVSDSHLILPGKEESNVTSVGWMTDEVHQVMFWVLPESS